MIPDPLPTDDEDNWRDLALCRGVSTATFFPEREGDNGEAAKAICRECPVRLACLEFGMDEQWGVFGGRSAIERRKIRRERRQRRW